MGVSNFPSYFDSCDDVKLLEKQTSVLNIIFDLDLVTDSWVQVWEIWALSREKILLLFTAKLTQPQDIGHFAFLNSLRAVKLGAFSGCDHASVELWIIHQHEQGKWKDCQKSAGCFLCFIVVTISVLIHFSSCCLLLGYFRIFLALWSYIVGFYFVLGNSAAEGPVPTKSSCY